MTKALSTRHRPAGPSRPERAAIESAAAARAELARARKDLDDVAAALAAAKSALRWLEEATRAFETDGAAPAQTVFALAKHVAGATGKKRALVATIASLEARAQEKAAAVQDAEAKASSAQERVAVLRRRSVASTP